MVVKVLLRKFTLLLGSEAILVLAQMFIGTQFNSALRISIFFRSFTDLDNQTAIYIAQYESSIISHYWGVFSKNRFRKITSLKEM